MSDTKHSPDVFAISAPSGVGKTTLIHKLIDDYPERFMLSISHTTRQIRGREKDGVDYHFVTEDFFQANLDSMLEYAVVHGNMYGTSKAEIERIFGLGRSPLLEIDVQGVDQVREKIDLVSIFILPPSMQEMWKRLEGRATDSLPTRWKRLLNAKTEIKNSEFYSYFLINDDFNTCYSKLRSALVDKRYEKLLTPAQAKVEKQRLLEEFERASWIEKIRSQVDEN